MCINLLVRLAVLTVGASLCGCASWQAAPLPIPNTTRVPPPGTGAYQLPNGYYNNGTTAVPPTTSMMHASQPAGGFRPATGGLPSTSLPATNLVASAPGQGSVPATFGQPQAIAQFTDAPTATVVAASATEPVTEPAAGRLTDATSAEPPSLQWQQYGGQ